MNNLAHQETNHDDIFNDFFRKLKTCYPSWRQQLKTKEEHTMFKQQWLLAFAENNINTPEKLELGLSFARKSESSWLPAVGEFIGWCTPTAESLGLPNVNEAYREAIFHTPEKEWSCSLVYFARLSIQQELRTLPEAQSFKIFNRMYEAVLDRILKGEELSAPPKPLPAPNQVSKRTDPKIVGGIIDDIFKENGWSR